MLRVGEASLAAEGVNIASNDNSEEGASTAQPDQLALGIALFEDRSALYFTL